MTDNDRLERRQFTLGIRRHSVTLQFVLKLWRPVFNPGDSAFLPRVMYIPGSGV